MHGYDYGAHNILMIVGDTLYVETWDKAQYVANMYGFYENYGILINPAFVAMIFENEEYGRKLFEQHFMKWAEDSRDGDAVSLTFIEWKDSSYTMVVHQDIEFLRKRAIGEENDLDDINIQVVVPSKAKDFTRKSDAFEQFKLAAKQNAILFTGGTINKRFSDCVIRKLKVQFYTEDSIPDDSIAIAFKKGRQQGDYSEHRDPQLEPVANIFQRREKNLKKYFPVTLERLKVLDIYTQLLQGLEKAGFSEWQIRQAICNLVISYQLFSEPHFSKMPSDEQRTKNIQDLLETYFETPQTPEIPTTAFSQAEVIKQINLDSYALLNSRNVKVSIRANTKKLQRLLRQNQLLTQTLE